MLWADDAEVMIGQPYETRLIGLDNIVFWLRHLWSGKEFFVQFATPGVIEINSDEATAHCICHEEARGLGETYYRTHGVFTDRLRRTADG